MATRIMVCFNNTRIIFENPYIYIYIYSFPEWSININTEFELHILHIERIFSSPALNFHLLDQCVFAIKSAPVQSTII